MTVADAPPAIASPGEAPNLQQFFQEIGAARDKRSLTHGLHPYPAKFIPHIPRYLIQKYSSVGETVMDPMCGSGTTLVEAIIQGRHAVGVDVNPIACLTSSAKTGVPTIESTSELASLADALAAPSAAIKRSVPDIPRLNLWFEPDVTAGLASCLELVRNVRDACARTVALACFSAIIVGVSNQESETRWASRSNPLSAAEVRRRLRFKIIEAISRVQELAAVRVGRATILRADARALPLQPESVDLVVTSPPYANSHDYYLYNKLRMFWLGYPVAPVQAAEIGSRNKHSDRKQNIGHYADAMSAVLRESERVTRPGGRIIVVVADAVIRGEFFDMSEMFEGLAGRGSLILRDYAAFDHKAHNATFQRGFGTTVAKQTHVLVWEKGATR